MRFDPGAPQGIKQPRLHKLLQRLLPNPIVLQWYLRRRFNSNHPNPSNRVRTHLPLLRALARHLRGNNLQTRPQILKQNNYLHSHKVQLQLQQQQHNLHQNRNKLLPFRNL
eukprot:PhF_6_TR10805/c0_g1_i2/m.17399